MYHNFSATIISLGEPSGYLLFVKAFINASPLKVAIGVLLFSYLIEFLQFFNFLEAIGLEHNKLARIVLGHGFERIDLIAYTLGIATVLLLSKNPRSQ